MLKFRQTLLAKASKQPFPTFVYSLPCYLTLLLMHSYYLPSVNIIVSLCSTKEFLMYVKCMFTNLCFVVELPKYSYKNKAVVSIFQCNLNYIFIIK